MLSGFKQFILRGNVIDMAVGVVIGAAFGGVVTELTKTPPWIAIAIYSDFVMSDYAKTLPTVKIPLLVFAADSGVFPKGIAMGKVLAGMAPRGTFVPFEDGGHLLFYEQPQKFNSTLAGFVKGLR